MLGTAIVRTSAAASLLGLGVVLGLGGCPTPPVPAHAPPPSQDRAVHDAAELLRYYNAGFVALRYEASLAHWKASTDVSEQHTGLRTGADTVLAAFTGSAEFIRNARELLEQRERLPALVVRQLETLLRRAAAAPQTNAELARKRIEAESTQSARLDGYSFCLRRSGDRCLQPVTPNEIDRVLVQSRDLEQRRRAYDASKEVGAVLRPGIDRLRALRNGVAREMGYADYFALQVDDYGLTVDEMMDLLDRLNDQIRPLYQALHCWTRYELARRYGVEPVPHRIPAHWLPNRWGQTWPGLVASVDRDAWLAGKKAPWLVRQAERFYVSTGFPPLPPSFWNQSDLYPVPDGTRREKNDHASAWHLDLEQDVRSLMSVEPRWQWFATTHHELGHVYYYLAYARDDVPPLLRRGTNRSFHEGMGTLMELAAHMPPYLQQIGLLPPGEGPSEIEVLLDWALTGPVVFLPFAAGTMSHFERKLYVEELPAERFQEAWWELAAKHQGIEPPEDPAEQGCDACTKTHINDDPAQYYDYALSEVLVYQLHRYICRELLGQAPRSCNYYGRKEVGRFLQQLMRVGATRDWQQLLQETTGEGLTAEPMLEFYEPLLQHLAEQNQDRDCKQFQQPTP